jgi:hypothetical protein
MERRQSGWLGSVKIDRNGKDPSPALLRRAPSPLALGEGLDLDSYPSPKAKGRPRPALSQPARVRGLFAPAAYIAFGARANDDFDEPWSG